VESWSRRMVVAAATLVLHLVIFLGFHYYEQSLKQTYTRESQARHRQWKREDQEREKKLQQAMNEQYGRAPEERVYHNPAMDLKQLLSFFAQRNLPKACEASAGVDRFTEFSVYLKCVRPPAKEVRTQYLRSILAWVDPAYVFQVAFIEEDGPTIVAEQPCLLKVKNWSSARDSEIIRACF